MAVVRTVMAADSPVIGADPPDALASPLWLYGILAVMAALAIAALCALAGWWRSRTMLRARAAELQQSALERERAELAAADNAQRHLQLMEHVPVGIVYTDLRGRVRQSNAVYRTLLGYPTERPMRNVADDIHPDDVPEDYALTGQLLRSEIATYTRQQRHLMRDGRTLHTQTTVSLVRDAARVPQALMRAVQDITEQLRLQDVERAREAAEMSSRAKSDFLSRMSHELRTPLNAMLGFAQLLEVDQRHPLNDAHRPWVGQIQDAGWHLLEMINDVLDLSRIDSGNLRLTIEPLTMHKLLSATLPLVEQNAARRGITITQHIASDADRMLGDATRVKQILTNLLTNSVKYNIDGGRIHIATRANDNTVEVAVTDTGLGMTREQLAELFQPFNRLGRERSSQQEGTGIGLVISKRLAELMGGELSVRSTAGEGSSFILRMPAPDAGDSVHSAYGALHEVTSDYHRRQVHYVEDNETNVEVMRGILAQRPQIEMTVSMTGMDGLNSIHALLPDIVLLDMHLPDISGMELLRSLKSDSATSGIPVVIVSADALAAQVDAALASGAVRYLTKPVNVGQTLQTIDELLELIDTHFG